MLHIGALLDRAPGRKYVAALRFAEFAPRAPLPRPATLASMRADLPQDFVLALRAPRSSVVSALGPLRMDPALQAGLDWLIAAADATAARAVVFNTPADLTPGARSRDLLRAYVAKLPRVEGRSYVWLPQGVWEAADAQAVCAELGLCYGFDPLESRPAPGEVAYATLRALGHRAGFSFAALSDAISTTLRHHPTEAFIAVDAERAFDVARRLQTLALEAQGLAANAAHAPAASSGAAFDEAEHSEQDALEHDDEDEDEDEDDENDEDDEDAFEARGLDPADDTPTSRRP